MPDWPFPDPPEFNVFSTRQVMEREQPILLVAHDEADGAWQFIGGPWQGEDLIVICLEHAVERDPTVRELANLPRGWAAKRGGEGLPWTRYRLPLEEDE